MINAHKHPFNDKSSGCIEVRSTVIDGKINIYIHNVGVGLPEDPQKMKPTSLGLNLIEKFAKTVTFGNWTSRQP